LKDTCIETLKLKYDGSSELKLKKIADLYSVTGIMKNKGTKGTTSIIELHDGVESILVYIKHESISKSSHIEFNSMKEDIRVTVKGRVFKNLKDKLCLDITHIEKAN